MKIHEMRSYPERDYRLVSMKIAGKTFAYSIVDNTETFEIYYSRNCQVTEGFYTSRAYKINKGEQSPKKYLRELEFLKNEFNKIDWETIEVTEKLTK